MDDNAPCHRVVLIDDFLETENIQHMSSPANSPDLNPIEHVWDMLGRQISALSQPPSSVTELKRALQESWNRLSAQVIHSSSHSKLGQRKQVCLQWIPSHVSVPRNEADHELAFRGCDLLTPVPLS
ncbi:transposable element Tcb2 transposase [Trichonephila clavipes]|nr:transposable element Tcb2 transposase [Trichonephila clavipes]